MTTLVVQRGHVARTSGATGAPGEQAMARRNAAEIVAIAADLPDVTPKIINADEPNVRYSGDAFIALHGDSSASSAAGGASVGYRNQEGAELGRAWKKLYSEGGWEAAGFGFRSDNYTTNLSRYYGTGQAVSAENPRAVIVEHGFMSNTAERAFIESEQGVKLAAAAAICAAYSNYDLDRLLKNAPKPEPKDTTPVPPSTEPSATIITVGDTGEDVRLWQADLRKLLPNHPDAHTPDGDFGPKTVRWTNAAFRVLGLTASDPARPLVGPRSRSTMEKELAYRSAAPPEPNWKGKRVRAKVNLNFYDSPRWTRPVGVMQRGHHFTTIEARIAVGGGYQYRVRNSRGAGPFYVTAASKYVDLV